MLKYMLDTDTIIYTIKNRPAEVREAFKRHSGHMCISTITLGELIYGAERSSRPDHNVTVIEGLIARMDLLPFDERAALHFGQIRAELASAGTPIGPYDQMIAGHARSAGLLLVTNNTKEFKRVSGLRVENWVQSR